MNIYVISYSDIVYSKYAVKIISEAKRRYRNSYDPNWLWLWNMRFQNPLIDAETFEYKKNILLEIGGKTDDINNIKGQYMGLLKITPLGWITVKSYLSNISCEIIDKLDMTALFRNLLKEGIIINVVPINDNWYEIDSESDLNVYENLKNCGKAMVVWLVGLSGAGKSTIGRELYSKWKLLSPNTVLIDGDEIRDLLKTTTHQSHIQLNQEELMPKE